MEIINSLNQNEINYFRKQLIKIIQKIRYSLLTAKIENKINSKKSSVKKLFLNEKFAVALSYSMNVFGYILIRTIFRTSNSLTPFKSIDKVREEVNRTDYSKLNDKKKIEISENNFNASMLGEIITELDVIKKNISGDDLELLRFMQAINNTLKENVDNGEYRFGESLILIIEVIKKYGLLQNLKYKELSDYLSNFVTNVNIRNEIALMYQNYNQNMYKYIDSQHHIKK